MKTTIKPFRGNYPVTQKFGVKVNYMRRGVHNGVDFGCPKGTKLIACFNGEIVECQKWNITGFGRNFKIQAPDGKTIAHYAHCSQIYVDNGLKVERGQEIAESGHSGFCISLRKGSKGAHLHFGLMYKKVWVDPLKYIKGYNLNLKIPVEDEDDEEEENDEKKNHKKYHYYKIKSGDNLSKIAKQFYGKSRLWPEILRANRDTIKNPNKIFEHQEIKILKKCGSSK